MAKILLVDDSTDVFYGLKLLLVDGEKHELTYVRTINEAMAENYMNYDMAIVDASLSYIDKDANDISLDRLPGFDLAHTIKERNPEIGLIVYTAYYDRKHEIKALLEKSQGVFFVPKRGDSGQQILKEIRNWLKKSGDDEDEYKFNERQEAYLKTLFPPMQSFIKQIYPNYPKLNPRYREIADYVRNGLPNPYIGELLAIEAGTVGSYVSDIYRFLNVKSNEYDQRMILGILAQLYNLE